MTVIDLFSGCGGLSLGFEMAGFDVKLAIDNWEDALVTYRYNHKGTSTLNADLLTLDPAKVEKDYNLHDIDVIIGGPPCQGFSVAGKRIIDDDRNKLYKSFVRFVHHFKPNAFVMENVPNILSIGNGAIKDAILKDFSVLGYNVQYKVLIASDYGVPQNRRRAIFVGKLDGEYIFPTSTAGKRITTKEAISDLPENTVNDGGNYPIAPQSDYQRLMREHSSTLNNHQTSQHSTQTQHIISLVPDGGNYKDLPLKFRETRKVHIAWTRLNSQKPSITIDTGHRHHFHYKFNRIPTVRESARIQSFSDDFIFLGSKTSQYKQVGNAVPPFMAKAIAENLKKNKTMYIVPENHFFRIHHVRPRFKDDVENVLFYIANVCKDIEGSSISDYNSRIFNALRLYPGNEIKTIKTINNWRTEIAALFGLYIEDKKSNITRTGSISKILAESGDLVQFFKYFLFKFQYPGGHIKSNYNKQLIDAKVKFKPARYILNLLHEADSYLGRPLGINKEEATHCIFNDLRVTRDNRDVKEVIDLIKSNRERGVDYDSNGDIIRYAGDILDYMVLANLLKVSHNYFYLNRSENEAILSFINNGEYFTGYDNFYDTNFNASNLSPIETDWFKYVNSGLDKDLFSTNITQYITDDEELQPSDYMLLVKEKISEVLASAKTKEIGDLGETLVVGHEKKRVKDGGREDLLHLIMKIPTSLAVGYDVQSVELDARKRYIEVKTTISTNPINFYTFHLTPNEWNTASSLNDRYFVYRLMISKNSLDIYILQDPIQMYKNNLLTLSVRGDGADLTFNAQNFEKTPLKIWKE